MPHLGCHLTWRNAFRNLQLIVRRVGISALWPRPTPVEDFPDLVPHEFLGGTFPCLPLPWKFFSSQRSPDFPYGYSAARHQQEQRRDAVVQTLTVTAAGTWRKATRAYRLRQPPHRASPQCLAEGPTWLQTMGSDVSGNRNDVLGNPSTTQGVRCRNPVFLRVFSSYFAHKWLLASVTPESLCLPPTAHHVEPECWESLLP